ncbi:MULTISPECIES: imidazolonepropionase [Myxococcus]|uniref:Imidazolonepropionase n=1 Tax=Myxococcus llanfairpwllgwyngyllgogerychwyrndrobwllllantysiliogogogochensis TaxID=2590453 RepID=A0A540WSQ5_9BACT|nr:MULTISPECIES: imidazolonepropionase [Myxococcus]NTX02026.1 imidazolonepropionase [Myxococcus sp. CA040A]TQF12066.1 imidazolonepropionase [Myxococcus llanfairpwllgwyngyllgogerychwyrndrobwllllantysiliogogogochensis]
MDALELLVRNTSEVLTLEGTHRERAETALTPKPGACVGVREGRIAFVGAESELPSGAVSSSTVVLDAEGGFVGPGFVDPHTHLVFAGERSAEFDLRNQGATYLEIAKAGGGIVSTVRATRAASEDELVRLALPRVQRLLEQGVTVAEVKSGYGLDLENELKMLRAVRRLGALTPVELVPTLLCAHAIPQEYRERREDYVRLCIEEILPAVAREGLARFCDVFVEDSAFTVDEARRILTTGRALGLVPRLHADQLTARGASELAAELGAATADHLEQVTDAGMRALADANVTAVLVPTSTLFLRMRPYAPGRRLRDAGLNIALGTNVNPGSAMSENTALALGLACLENGLSAAEAYWAATRGAALSLGLQRHGRLAVGDAGDLVLFSCASFRHLPYHLGVGHARTVVKAGRVVVRQELNSCG